MCVCVFFYIVRLLHVVTNSAPSGIIHSLQLLDHRSAALPLHFSFFMQSQRVPGAGVGALEKRLGRDIACASVDLSDDGSVLLSSNGAEVIQWDLWHGASESVLTGHQDGVLSLALSRRALALKVNIQVSRSRTEVRRGF